MRKIIIGLFALVAVAGASACGSNDKTGSKGDGKAPGSSAVDLTRKVAVKPDASTGGEAAGATRPDNPDAASKGVRYSLVLGEGRGGFAFNTVTLSDEAKAKIDEMFTGTKVDLAGARFEIEGHTDNVGSKEANERIGLARADAVKQYLCEQYEILPERISVVSYGLEKPVADNATDDGRAQNRRVVIKVLD